MGLFSNNEKLSDTLHEVGEITGDLVWRMPLDANYGKQMISKIADLRNIGLSSAGSSIQAACFLEHFVDKKTPWAHLDVAGVVWSNKQGDLFPAGATGWGVKLLSEFIKKERCQMRIFLLRLLFPGRIPPLRRRRKEG